MKPEDLDYFATEFSRTGLRASVGQAVRVEPHAQGAFRIGIHHPFGHAGLLVVSDVKLLAGFDTPPSKR